MDRGAWRATVHGIAESDMTGNTHTAILTVIQKDPALPKLLSALRW